MFLSAIGFIALIVVLGMITLTYFLVALNGLGKYNVGGVENSLPKKLIVLTLGFVLGWGWYALFSLGPLSVRFSV